MLRINAVLNYFTVERKADTEQERTNPCTVNVKDKHIYLIGGISANGNNLGSVSRYDIINDKWEVMPMPELNEARHSASACYIGGKIYVVGGIKEQ